MCCHAEAKCSHHIILSILSIIFWRRGESSTASLLLTLIDGGPKPQIQDHSIYAPSQEATSTMNTSSSTHQLATDDEGDIPFILLTPTKKAPEDAEGTAADDVEDSPLQISFFLKPRRSCHKYSHSCGNSPEMDAKPSSSDAEMHGWESFSATADKTIMDLCSSPRKSPVPTLLDTSFGVMLTPPRINLLKRSRHGSQEPQQVQPKEDDGSSSEANGPLFPVLNLKQHQKQRPNLCRPIPRRRR